MTNNLKIIVILLLLIVGGAGFFAGTKYQQSQTQNAFRQGFNGQMPTRNRAGGANANGAATRGDIIDVSNASITIKLADGSSKIVLVSDKTTISTTSAGSKSDLKNGETVAVFGTTNSDGSLTAQNVQINPQDRGVRPSGQPNGQ